MKRYLFTECRGKYPGGYLIVEADTVEAACEKAGKTERISIYDRFPAWSAKKIFEVKEFGQARTLCVCR